MNKYNKLREIYKTFEYTAYEIVKLQDEIKLTYFFRIPGLAEFKPQWTLKKTDVDIENRTFEEMVFNLGMVELISYWKIACPKEVIIKAGHLDEWQKAWWKDQYYNGLGEFFYTNNIELDPYGFMNITSVGKELKGDRKPLDKGNKVLIPVGGGKDSVVTLEIAKSAEFEREAYIINPRGATINTAMAAGISNPIVAGRTLDKEMLRLNSEGYLNGHTPFSAIVAFSSLIAAYLNKASYIALSNESSANESTVKGSSVNHQYSKSFKFEKDFGEYERRYIGTNILYFSMLRPLSEFQIAALFAHYPQYHGIFRSCNAGSRQDIWCGHCPKCLFVFIILSPFLFHDEVVNIFGRDMLDDGEMKEDFYKLIGIEDEKPFECVGSRDEINTALVLTVDKMENMGMELPLLLKCYKNTGLYESYKKSGINYFNYYDRENLLPERFEKALKDKLEEL